MIHYIEGVAGGGKSSFLLSIMEQKLAEGLRPHQIGFVTFSRAAAREAAERAAKITDGSVDTLTETGWFRTLHSCTLRCLGISGSSILDADSAKGRAWFKENMGTERGDNNSELQDQGYGRQVRHDEETYAGRVAAALNKWDLYRSQVSTETIGLNSSTVQHQNRRPERSSTSYGDIDRCETTENGEIYTGLYTKEVGFPSECPETQLVESKELRPIDEAVLDTQDTQRTLVDTRFLGDCPRVSPMKTQVRTLVPDTLTRGRERILSTEHMDCTKGECPESDCPETLFSRNDCPECPETDLTNKNIGKNTDSHDCPRLSTSVHECPEIVPTTPRTQAGEDGKKICSHSTPIGSSEAEHTFTDEDREIIGRYEFSKRQDGKVDFTDLLLRFAGIRFGNDLRPENAYQEGSTPADVRVWFVDEAQDNSPLLDDVVRRLTEQAEEVHIAGDPHQAVYGFAGSDPMRFRDWKFISDKRTLLRRSWRNPECVLEWAEKMLLQKDWYETRQPFSEFDGGSVALVLRSDFMTWLTQLTRMPKDSLIIARAWFMLQPIKTHLDQHSIPWQSCNEKMPSRWQAPAKIAYTLAMRDLAQGRKISEQDFRRIIDTLNQKLDQKELFRRGEKTRWKKLECSNTLQYSLKDTTTLGATEHFVELVESGKWLFDMPLLINDAIEKFGVDNVRNPKIRLGTVHSVKGLEANDVYCLADSTERCFAQDGNDEDLNLKYVAITRTIENYRLVVDPFKAAAGKPMFWAAPKGINDFDRRSPLERIKTANRCSPLDQISDECLGHEVPRRDPRKQRNTGPPDLLRREVPRDRTEDRQREGGGYADVPAEPDQECWWNF